MERRCGYGNFDHRYNVSPIHLHAFLGVGNFMKDGWSACAPTACKVVCDCQKSEIH
jgi:hypothetical protein